MQLSGVGLEGEAKEQFNGNQMKLAELSTAFSNNLLDATKAYSMLITEPAQVCGAAGEEQGLDRRERFQRRSQHRRLLAQRGRLRRRSLLEEAI